MRWYLLTLGPSGDFLAYIGRQVGAFLAPAPEQSGPVRFAFAPQLTGERKTR